MRSLKNITLCAITSINIDSTISALYRSMAEADFARVLLFTDRSDLDVQSSVNIIPIESIKSSLDYSSFVIKKLYQYIETDYVLIVQWDGFIIDGKIWRDDFLNYDYIGASWPQFDDDHIVGNGGFSLRSRKLLKACSDPRFKFSHPEDVSICRDNRSFLEESIGVRFANKAVADVFSYERYHHGAPTFGFHGAFNLIRAVGASKFFEIYAGLDDRKSVFIDFRLIIFQIFIRARRTGWRQSIKMIGRLGFDYLESRRLLKQGIK